MGNFIGKYKKVFGILGLLVFVCAFTAFMAPSSFLKAANIENTVRWTALFGIISVGVSFVIMTGGIDLSIGSVVGLVGCILAMSLNTSYLAQDQLEVTGVRPAEKRIQVRGDGSMYKPGDQFSFLEEVYTVSRGQDSLLWVEEELTDGENLGRLLRAHEPLSLSAESTEAARRGAMEMRTRRLVIAGAQTDLGADDRLTLKPEVGLAQEFTIRSIEVAEGQTTIEFFVRTGQRVRDPAIVFVAKRSQRMATWQAILLALGVSLLIGLVHGLLITKVKLQPFVVTLCGLLIYRGVSRYLTGDQEQGFGSEYPELKELAKGDFLQLMTGNEFAFDLPMPFIYLIILAVVAAVFLNKTIFGRYILALGRNEEAARYSGINTQAMTIVAYMICSFCAGLAAILFALDLNSIQPSAHGEFYELYAIAAAVLGGCSLRGGEGSILGVVIAAAVMRVLNNAINLIDGIDTSTEFAIIGLVILIGVTVDEVVRRVASARRALAASQPMSDGAD